MDREYYLELGSCSKPVIKTSEGLRCITVTGKTVLFNTAHTMRVILRFASEITVSEMKR